MMSFLRKYQLRITIGLAVVMLLYIFIGLGGNFFLANKNPDSIAEVNGEKIPMRLFYSHYRRSMDSLKPGTTPDPALIKEKRDEALRDLVQSYIFAEEAERFGILVPDNQVAISLTQVPAFQEKGVFSPRLYGQALQYEIHLTPQEFEEEQRRSIAFFKLRWLIQSSVKVTDQEFAMIQALNPPKKRLSPAEETKARDDYWQQKVLWSFNQWFTQLGQHTRVKPHFENLEGGTP